MKEVKDLIRQRRFQAFAIEADSLVEFFQISKEGHLRIPVFYNLPNDALLWRTYHDQESDSFVFMFMHKSFESVPVGSRPMVRPASYHLIELLPDQEKGKGLKDAISMTPDKINKKIKEVKGHVKKNKT